MLSGDAALRPSGKSATKILPALPGSKAGLAFGGTGSFQCSGGIDPLPLRRDPSQFTYQGAGNQAGVVEAALPALAAVERHGHDQQGGWQVGSLGDRLGQPLSQFARERCHTAVLQEVNQPPKLVFIDAEGKGAPERRGRQPARLAKAVAGRT